MDNKPSGYTTFEKFVEDIQTGKNPVKKEKKKKTTKGGPFLPQRQLNLPEPPQKKEEPATDQKKGKGRGKKVKQYSYYGPGTERVYGRGRATGYNYYGDGRDVYYPPGYGGSTGRKLTGKQQQEMFAMGDMQAALAYYEYDTQQQRQRRRPLYQQN